MFLAFFFINTNLQGQIWMDCPDWNCKKAGFIIGLSNNNLEEVAQKFGVKRIVVKSIDKRTRFTYTFNKSGKVIHRDYDQLSTTRYSYHFKYDEKNRIIKSTYSQRGCFDSRYSEEYYTYNDTSCLKIEISDIRPIHIKDTISQEWAKIGEAPYRKTYYENDKIVKVDLYDIKTQKLLRTVNVKNDTSKMDSLINLSFRDTLGFGLDTFMKWIWTKDSFSLLNNSNSKEIIKDNFNRDWLYSYNDKGLRISEELINYENDKKASKYKTYIEYEYFE